MSEKLVSLCTSAAWSERRYERPEGAVILQHLGTIISTLQD